ncbi:hypothetical protein [uncultured Bacteroides sp.]|nr:hypothetical protein [uncultured Bacteroides sp.]
MGKGWLIGAEGVAHRWGRQVALVGKTFFNVQKSVLSQLSPLPEGGELG